MTVIRPGGLGAAVALLGALFVVDQATKLWVLSLDLAEPWAVTPFLDITLVWNRGISYGLLQSEGLGRWALVVVTIAASIGLGIWMVRATRPAVRLGLAAIVGGALGNLVDRLAYGAVVDFVHLHAGDFSWYVFNVADAAIVFGVVALLSDGLLAGRSERSATSG